MKSYNPFSLEGKTVLVTGASSGIGQGVSVECANMGAELYLSGRSIEGLTLTQSQAVGAKIIIADLLTDTDRKQLVGSVPQLDGVVLCAGVNKKEPVSFVSDLTLQNIMETNFTSNVLLLKSLLRKKKLSRGASIVFISSISVDIPAIGNAVYAASKGAISSFMKVMALEMAPKNIRVNTIEPGMIRTPWLERSLTTSEQFAADELRYPLGRYGMPKDIALATVFLLSDASSWTTGTAIRIDGGISLL